ncbi:hypothetical protein GSI_08421 [Ganoderma sinense ZZ0214-1]|uniref:Nephrocystin 3-like N-terminal domain-containing protein n=1 Tax=Ganoderma sinense ZZ0214-1 TaxID=1077348 RepID=A0A2G8S6S2_9APHY|nr:hypothetical protein GSI_08421 [Ganoderma sinense ZZ0214-1]
MNCFRPCDGGDVDDVLSNAKAVLESGKAAFATSPIRGLNRLTDVLVSLIDGISRISRHPLHPPPKTPGSNAHPLAVLSREISHLVRLIDGTTRRVRNCIEKCPANDPKRHALEDDLRSPALSNHFEQLSTNLTELKARADGINRGPPLLKYLHGQRDSRALDDIRNGVHEAVEYYDNKCRPVIERSVDNCFQAGTDSEKTKKTTEETVHRTLETDESFADGDSGGIDLGVVLDDTILETLPHAAADCQSPIQRLKNHLQTGTRLEVLEELEDWVHTAPSDKSICVLNGAVGTGKSSIASHFARRLRESGHLGAAIFFDRGVDALSSTRLFFSSLAYQLAHSQDSFRPHVFTAVEEYLRLGRSQDVKYQGEHLVRQPLLAARNQRTPVVIVVDAVDECEEDSPGLLSTVLQLLATCVRDVTFPLRIFLTSVPEHFLDGPLSQGTVTVRRMSLHTLSRESVNRDIAIFIRNRLSRMKSSKSLLAERPDLVDRLVIRANGLFVYARTAMDFFHDDPEKLEERLDLLFSIIPSGLEPLDSLYLSILQYAFPPTRLEQQPALRAVVQSVLGCIPVLRDPISPRALESLVHVPYKDSLPVLHQLRCMILSNGNDPDELFRPVHATFAQFLASSARCPNRLYLVDVKRANARLAEGCLKVIRNLDKNMCRLEDPSLRKADIPDLADRLHTHVPPHVQYACLHWATHLQGACRPGDAHETKGCRCVELVDLVKDFATMKMLVWMEALGYLGRLDVAMRGLVAARDYLGTRHPRIRSVLEGGCQLLVDHQAEIEACPDDVYLSKIPQEGYTSADREPESSFIDRNGHNVKIGLF